MSEITIEDFDEKEFPEGWVKEIESRMEDYGNSEKWHTLPDWVETAEDFAKWVDSIQIEKEIDHEH